MAQKRRTASKRRGPQTRAQEIHQRTNEMQAAFQQVAQRYGVRHLVIVVGDDQGLHSFTAPCEGWIAQALDRLVHQVLAAVGTAARGVSRAWPGTCGGPWRGTRLAQDPSTLRQPPRRTEDEPIRGS